MKRKFLFLSVNSSYSHTSTALPMLHAASSHLDNWQWYFIECTVAEDAAEIATKMTEYAPELVGCSLYLFNRNAVMEILSRFHQLMPKCKIVIGGPECARDNANDILKKYPFVNTVFIGAAEGLFAEYLENFGGADTKKILPETGSAVYEKWTEKFPADDPFFRTDKAFVQIETSRGCPMGCKYCTSSSISLQLKELDDVKKELERVRAKGVKEVRLLDRTFNFPLWRGAALLKLFREDFPEIEFHLEIHPHFLDDALKEELRMAPNLHVEAGIQSFDENVQRAIGRNCRKKDALDGVKFLASCKNFETHTDLICGLPEQDADSIFSDVAELINCRVGEIQLETLKILPGTEMRRMADELQLVYAQDVPYDVMQTPKISANDMLYIRKLSRMLDLFYNHEALRKIVQSIPFGNGDDVKKMLDFMIDRGVTAGRLFDLKKRLLLLADFAAENYLKDAQFEIGKAWIEGSYPLSSLPFGRVEKFYGELPEEFSAEQRAAEIIAHKETKIWQLICNDRVFIFALNRHFKLNGCAIGCEQK